MRNGDKSKAFKLFESSLNLLQSEASIRRGKNLGFFASNRGVNPAILIENGIGKGNTLKDYNNFLKKSSDR